jgi:hypothetical protein
VVNGGILISLSEEDVSLVLQLLPFLGRGW